MSFSWKVTNLQQQQKKLHTKIKAHNVKWYEATRWHFNLICFKDFAFNIYIVKNMKIFFWVYQGLETNVYMLFFNTKNKSTRKIISLKFTKKSIIFLKANSKREKVITFSLFVVPYYIIFVFSSTSCL